MKIKPCMYEKVVGKFLNWREEDEMPAAVEFYKAILETIGTAEFSEWAKIGCARGDLSLYILRKTKSNQDSVSGIETLNTTEKRVKFMEDNQGEFIAFAQERYVPFVLPLEQIIAMLKAGNKTPDYTLVLDKAMLKIVTEMGNYYRYFVYHVLDRADGCESESTASQTYVSEGG